MKFLCIPCDQQMDFNERAEPGDGTFGAQTTFGTGPSPRSVALGDLDGDLDLDIATANFGSEDVSILLNAGDATFDLDTSYPAGGGPYSLAINSSFRSTSIR